MQVVQFKLFELEVQVESVEKLAIDLQMIITDY
jgi:hypothetical protein